MMDESIKSIIMNLKVNIYLIISCIFVLTYIKSLCNTIIFILFLYPPKLKKNKRTTIIFLLIGQI